MNIELFAKYGVVPFKQLEREFFDYVIRKSLSKISYDDVAILIKRHPEIADDVFVTSGLLNPIILFDGEALILELFFEESYINRIIPKYLELKNSLSLSDKLSISPKVYRIFLLDFAMNYKDLPKDVLRSLAIVSYQNAETGFENLDFGKIFGDTKGNAEDIVELKREYPNDKVLKIFRGEASKSLTLEETLSWSLSKDQAKFFATRFGEQGKLYSAEVLVDDVLAYLKKPEREVLVLYNNLIDIREEDR